LKVTPQTDEHTAAVFPTVAYSMDGFRTEVTSLRVPCFQDFRYFSAMVCSRAHPAVGCTAPKVQHHTNLGQRSRNGGEITLANISLSLRMNLAGERGGATARVAPTVGDGLGGRKGQVAVPDA